jgi:peptidoglycan/LPS O-acetylase OafA/YrhL
MTFLPIVGRELRVAARRRGTYWTRLVIACVAIAFGGWVMLIPDFRTPQNLGLALFTSLSVVAFIYSLLAGVRTTADCLSEEKREGTLGLLFLTDLKGYDIVFGKLTATSVNAAYGLLAIFPVMAIPLLLGGVAGGGDVLFGRQPGRTQGDGADVSHSPVVCAGFAGGRDFRSANGSGTPATASIFLHSQSRLRRLHVVRGDGHQLPPV